MGIGVTSDGEGRARSGFGLASGTCASSTSSRRGRATGRGRRDASNVERARVEPRTSANERRRRRVVTPGSNPTEARDLALTHLLHEDVGRIGRLVRGEETHDSGPTRGLALERGVLRRGSPRTVVASERHDGVGSDELLALAWRGRLNAPKDAPLRLFFSPSVLSVSTSRCCLLAAGFVDEPRLFVWRASKSFPADPAFVETNLGARKRFRNFFFLAGPASASAMRPHNHGYCSATHGGPCVTR